MMSICLGIRVSVWSTVQVNPHVKVYEVCVCFISTVYGEFACSPN